MTQNIKWQWVADDSKILLLFLLFISCQILLMGFLKVLEDGSHMIMMECPDAVNTLLHEFFLWEPATPQPPKKDSKTRPETAKAQSPMLHLTLPKADLQLLAIQQKQEMTED